MKRTDAIRLIEETGIRNGFSPFGIHVVVELFKSLIVGGVENKVEKAFNSAVVLVCVHEK